MTDEIKQPESAPKKEEPKDAPADPNAGKAEDKPQGSPQDDIPEKFKGKSPAEIAKAYVELEREHGKVKNEVGTTRDEIAQWKALGNVIKGNPKLKEAIQQEIDRLAGKKPDDTKPEEPKQPDDTRIALENQIIDKVEGKYGLSQLDAEKKKELEKRIGTELADMYDPGGTKPPSEVLRSIPLDKLERSIEKAYRLATLDDQVERARSQAYIEARVNNEARIGSMAATGTSGESLVLTPGQKEAARKMGISEEDYKKQLQEIQKEQS